MTLEEQIRQQWGSYGEWNAGGVDRVSELAGLLRARGINSLGALSMVPGEQRVVGYNQVGMDGWEPSYASGDRFKIGDAEFGFLGDINNDGSYSGPAKWLVGDDGRAFLNRDLVAWSARGDGNVGYKLVPTEGGGYAIAPTWGSSSDTDFWRDAIKGSLGVAAALGGAHLLSGALGGAAGAGGSASGALGGTLDGSLAALEATGGSGLGLGGGGAAGATAGGGALSAATNPALIESAVGTAGYGASSAGAGNALSAAAGGLGMTGAQTSVFDAVSTLTGSNSLAAGAANAATGSIGEALGKGWDWLSSTLGGGIPGGGSLFGNGWLRDVLGLVGAGVQQMNVEKMAQDQRDWMDARDAASRRRRMPTSALAAARFTVNGRPVDGG